MLSAHPKKRVLLICMGNIARSQMAEGWWRHHGGEHWEVHSAGTRARSYVHPMAIRVMSERGIDISRQHPKPVTQFVDQRFDLVVTVCSTADAECPAFPHAAVRECWPIEDPVVAGDSEERQLEVFRRIRDQLGTRIREFLERSAP